MESIDLWDALYQKAKTDAWYQECLVKRTEPAFLAIRDSLDETQKEQPDGCIAACEALEDSLAFLAYELGKK